MTPEHRALLSELRAFFGDAPPRRLGIAVSGGGDSVALMHLLRQCFAPADVTLYAATVDHGLRDGAAAEAAQVARQAAALGVPHQVLRWEGWDRRGNLQHQARQARYGLLADWARSLGLAQVALGHTADDQAETVLMRLGRAAGVTGLSAMPARRVQGGITLLRPLLGVRRAMLRDYLRAQQVAWTEDPSNDDPRFDRIRLRQAMDALAQMGLSIEALCDVAANMRDAEAALGVYADREARAMTRIDGGDIVFDTEAFRALPQEVARRLLSRAIAWIGQGAYAPRRAPVAGLIAGIAQGRSGTLGGCRIITRARVIRVCREYQAVKDLRVPVAETWDGRWRLSGGDAEGGILAALGPEGLAQCPNWRDTGRPHAALIASPAVWYEGALVAAPLAGRPNGWRAEVAGGAEGWFSTLLSH